MAMKFWFGKKDSSVESQEKVSCDVLAVQDSSGGTNGSGPQLFGVASVPVAVVASAGGGKGSGLDGQQQVVGVGDGMEAVKAVNVMVSDAEAARSVPQLLGQPLVGKDSAKTSDPQTGQPVSTEGAKLVLRPVGAPVRLAGAIPSAEAEKKACAPIAGVGVVPAPSASVANDGNGTSRTAAFGFRAKSKVAEAPAAAAPATAVSSVSAAQPAKPADKAEPKAGEPSLVRPKTDQRALYYELMNGIYDAVLILDDQGHVVDSNTRVQTVLGYAREDMWDMPIDKVITGMTSQMFEHLRRNLAENHHVLIDARCFRQDGTAFAGEVGVSQLSLTRGGNLVFVIRNVDRRKTAMEELRKGQIAMQVSLAPTFVCDMDGFFQMVNQSLLEAFGIPDEKQARSVRFVDLLPDAARYFLRASCGEKLRETVLIATPEGGTVKVELVLSPVQNGQTVTAVAGSLLQQ